MKSYKRRLTNESRAERRSRARADPYLSNVLDFLRSTEMRAVSDALGGVESRSLVDLRYYLADAFVQNVRTVQGDRLKPNRSVRRKALKSLLEKAHDLRKEVEANIPWLRDEHYTAKFFGASGPDWSPFEYDYVSPLDAIERLENIAQTILSVPPIGIGKTTSPFLAGFPSDRIENPGSGAQFGFARRIGQIYFDLTENVPGVTNEQAGPYQRMMAVTCGIFLRAYKAADMPFGEWRTPSREIMQQACKSIGRKST